MDEETALSLDDGADFIFCMCRMLHPKVRFFEVDGEKAVDSCGNRIFKSVLGEQFFLLKYPSGGDHLLLHVGRCSENPAQGSCIYHGCLLHKCVDTSSVIEVELSISKFMEKLDKFE